MLLDTSAIVELLRNEPGSARFVSIIKAIGKEEVFVSILELAEMADWASRNGLNPREMLGAVKEITRVVQLDEQICIEASSVKQRRRASGRADFGLLDGIVLATARSLGQKMITLDPDFAGESDCVVLS